MFDLDIRIIGNKKSHMMLQFAHFKEHQEAITFILKCIELITTWYDCDKTVTQFTSHVTTPNVITLYRDDTHPCAIFRIIERSDSNGNSSRQGNEAYPTNYQDKRDSLSLENKTVQDSDEYATVRR